MRAAELRVTMNDTGDSVENLPAVTGETAPASQGRALEILAVLQTTLELDKLIELFSGELQKTLPHDSIGYENPVQDIELDIGARARHSCTYRLVVGEESLGRITLTRARRFSTEDVAAIENLLVSLVYPLRNALAHQRALESALKDALTGLYNRAAMTNALHREIRLARRHKAPLSLLMLDIDRFKHINDSYGHAAGDTALKVLAACVANCIRNTDVLARFGGEEFAVLLNSTERKGALLLAERICAAARALRFSHNGTEIGLTVSLGVATLQDPDDEKTLFERADQALYRAKHNGRDRVECAD